MKSDYHTKLLRIESRSDFEDTCDMAKKLEECIETLKLLYNTDSYPVQVIIGGLEEHLKLLDTTIDNHIDNNLEKFR